MGLLGKILKYWCLSIFNSFYDHVSRVKKNLPYLHLLTCCPEHQRQFLLETATPEQIHALVQILFNMLHGNIPVSKEVKRSLKKHIDALVSLVESSVPYKTKKQTLAQEGGGFIQDLLIPVLTSIGPLML